tara:strand:- start:194 stop:1072 length:879 start_codon:yes stop_codon:yes gene_type:complete
MTQDKDYNRFRSEIDELLIKKLDVSAFPAKIIDPIKYIFINKGKKVRSIILAESCALFGVNSTEILHLALALECIHTYSLIHDDLPAMDDDDYRRGELTLHKKYDEATAILVGDALISLAFELISEDNNFSSDCRIRLIWNLAVYSGGKGMVGGQILDLALRPSEASIENIKKMQQMKTGDLFCFAFTAGPIIAGSGKDDEEKLFHFGKLFGLIFQISDDLIDVESTLTEAGKSVNKDKNMDKATLVDHYGVDEAKNLMKIYIKEAEITLEKYGSKAKPLLDLCKNLADRRS